MSVNDMKSLSSLESLACIWMPCAVMVPFIFGIFLISFLNPSNSTGFDVLTYSRGKNFDLVQDLGFFAVSILVFVYNLADGPLCRWAGVQYFLTDAFSGVIRLVVFLRRVSGLGHLLRYPQ